ncbi:uncharacterized protein HHUB_1337 [Halobacterium hubeiense]|uniref:Uncharacterized protein n=1 Tax=Halobacterium hubeiense TaxID=1407499 RepID=A0A0U5H167_9EURY|nr:hypothetical protein [Halobacterium hubeiense]CQH47581.1 uncharacterized protein HHUB_1337 [Halobacterium hubeiense]
MGNESDLDEEFVNELVSVCRTAVGDRLRSITYFDTAHEEQLYLRDDLESGANIVGFANAERNGFTSKRVYEDTELGDYQFTIRAFEDGYLTRVIHGYHGAFVTTDRLPTERFEDLASAVDSVLAEYDTAWLRPD